MSDPKRYVIQNVDALIRIMHADPVYALAFRKRAERLITTKLRGKMVRCPPENVGDAFSSALLKLLQTRSFRDEALREGQPAEGWSAHELAESKLGGYLYRSSYHELIQHYRRTRHEVDINDDDDDFINSIEDTSPYSNPATAYERMSLMDRLRHCIERLSDTLRQTMQMYLDEQSMQEIADAQQLHVPTVKSRLHSARQLVADCARKGMD